MKFKEDSFYHVFNRGVNKQKVFFTNDNYAFFISKMRDLVVPNCCLVAYCLMPNHFHILIYVNQKNTKQNKSGQMQVLVRKLGTLQSSYARAINLQENRVGPLFQAKLKAIELDHEHSITCFHYIHQNALKAGLCNSLEGWTYSSYLEYAGTSPFGLCDQQIAHEYLEIPQDSGRFMVESTGVILNEKTIRNMINYGRK